MVVRQVPGQEADRRKAESAAFERLDYQGISSGRPRRRDLRDDVDAIAAVLDHAGEAANLALHPVQPFQDGSLDLCAHAPNIPL